MTYHIMWVGMGEYNVPIDTQQVISGDKIYYVEWDVKL